MGASGSPVQWKGGQEQLQLNHMSGAAWGDQQAEDEARHNAHNWSGTGLRSIELEICHVGGLLCMPNRRSWSGLPTLQQLIS